MKDEWVNKKVDYNFRGHTRSYKAALSGLAIATKFEFNFIIELVFMVAVIVAGIFFNITKLEWIIIIFCIGIILSAELMNTSIEALIDLKQFNLVVKKVKDLAAAAVFIVAIMDVIIGLIIFLPYVSDFLNL